MSKIKEAKMNETRMNRVEERVNVLESDVKELKKGQHEIEKSQAETRVYVKQIFDLINDLKAMVQHPRKPPNDKQWMDLFKFVLGGTIFIIVAYFFTNF